MKTESQVKRLQWPLISLVVTFLYLCLTQWRRLAEVRTSFINAGTDNEGTFWWLMDRCRADDGFLSVSESKNVAHPMGYDVSNMPFWNLFDHMRFFLARAVDCNPVETLFMFNILHLTVIGCMAVAVHLLFLNITSSNKLATLGVAMFMPITYLADSMFQMSGSVQFFGIYALSILHKASRAQKLTASTQIQIFLMFLVQTSINIYSGLFTLTISLGVIVFIFSKSTSDTKMLRLKLVSLGIAGFVLGAMPLLVPQILSIFESTLLVLNRPLEIERNFINPWKLFSRPSNAWFGVSVSETGLGPIRPWISVGLIMSLIGGFIVFLWSQQVTALLWKRLLLLTTSISFTYLSVTGLSTVTKTFVEISMFVRAVSLFQFYFFLYLVGMSLIVIKHLFDLRLGKKTYGLLIALLIPTVHIVEVLETQPSQNANVPLTTVIEPWTNLRSHLQDGPVAHYPDVYDEWGLYKFGFPNRIIHFAQIGMNLPTVNGRDASEFLGGCGILPDPSKTEGIRQLKVGGVQTVILHRRFLETADFNLIYENFLKSTDWNYVGNVSELSTISINDDDVAIIKSLDTAVFTQIDKAVPSHMLCRFPRKNEKINIDTKVLAPVYPSEIDGNGKYWWHTGSPSRGFLLLQLAEPMLNRSVYLNFGSNPCGQDVTVQYRILNNDKTEALKHFIVGKTNVEVKIRDVVNNWWEKIEVEFVLDETVCTIEGDPRNFGVRIYGAYLK